MMNGRATAVIAVAYLLVCAAAAWGFYRMGRGPDAAAAPEAGVPAGGAALSGLPSNNPASAAKRFAAAAEDSFSLRPKPFDTSFAKAARGVVFEVDPDALLSVSELAEDECEPAARAALALTERPRVKLLVVVLARWAEFAPQDAAEFALENVGSREIRESLAAVFQSWGRDDPDAALAWCEEARASERIPSRASSAIGHLFYSWGQSDPEAAGAGAQELADSGGGSVGWTGLAGLANFDASREGVLTAAMAVEDAAARSKALGYIFREWATRDPASAATWLDDNGVSDSSVQLSVSREFEKLDPQANVEWLLGRAAEADRDKVLSKALYVWSRTDIESAAAWLEDLGPTDGSIGVIAQGYGAVGDLDQAIAWAARAREDQRDATIAGALANAVTHGRNFDISAHLGAGSLSAEEMQAEVEKRRKEMERF